MKILLVGETGSDKLGDRAIFASLEYLLESRGHSVDGWDLSRNEYFAPGDDTRRHDRSGGRPESLRRRVRASLLRLVDLLPGPMQRWVVFLTKTRHAVRGRRRWRREVERHDLVLFGGGALLMDNNWSFPLALLNFSRAVRAAGRPYACIGCSTGSHYSAMSKRWLREFLANCQYIALRDEKSRESLKLIDDYVTDVFVDSALTVSRIYPPAPRTVGRGRKLGLNVMSRVWHPRLNASVYGRYIEAVEGFIEAVDEGGAGPWDRIELFVTGEPADLEVASAVADKARARCRRVAIDIRPLPATLEALCMVMADLDLVVATRMHAGILGKSYGRPLVAIEWDGKIRGFCELLGIEDSCIPIERVDAAALAQAARRIADAGFVQPDSAQDHIAQLAVMMDRIDRLDPGAGGRPDDV